MKARILNMEELSDSIELYESKPKKICSLFVYFVLIIIIVGLIWSYFSKVEVTIKVLGIIKNKEEKTVFTSQQSGVIEKCFVKSGDKVKVGDSLYAIETKDIDKQIKDYELQLEDINSKKSMICMYIMYLEGNTGEWETYKDNKFYWDYNAKKLLIDSKCNGLDEATISTIKQTEIAVMYEEKNLYEEKYAEIKSLIENLELQKEKSIVCSNQEGIITIKDNIVEGFSLQEGEEVLSITPEAKESYTIEGYLTDTEIGKVSEGMNVKFELNAYAAKEYGYVTGVIENIADETIQSKANGQSYYLLRIKVNSYDLKNDNNTTVEIKNGMKGTIQIITSRERVLKLLLKKMKIL